MTLQERINNRTAQEMEARIERWATAITHIVSVDLGIPFRELSHKKKEVAVEALEKGPVDKKIFFGLEEWKVRPYLRGIYRACQKDIAPVDMTLSERFESMVSELERKKKDQKTKALRAQIGQESWVALQEYMERKSQ